MQLGTSYRQILSISLPIMLGSAVQNIIALSDSVFLYHLSEVDFAAIGFVGVFYLIIAAIGFGFSKGGQIIIARRVGEGKYIEVGRSFHALAIFELALAVIMFLFMQYGCHYFFALFVNSDLIFYKSLEYLEYRSYGVFFSYVGVAIVALYTGVARPMFIVVDTIILAVVNIVLNYALIFGYEGMGLSIPAMGIAGAGLASTIAEGVAFVIFLIYMLWDKKAAHYHIFKWPRLDIPLIRKQLKIGIPIVAQAVVGLGSWFIFFGLVENYGERQLAVTNLVRMVYLFLSIPSWGFASGINTLVSNFIGQKKRMAVIPMIWKTAKICFLTTMILSLPVVLFPESVLYPLLGSNELLDVKKREGDQSKVFNLDQGTKTAQEAADLSLIQEAQPIFWVMFVILTLFSIGSVYFNGLAGTGATYFGLKIQFYCAMGYLAFIFVVVKLTSAGLIWAWSSEIFYWVVMIGLTIKYLRSRKWHQLKF